MENPAVDMTPSGTLVIRSRYADGRIEAMCAMRSGDWWVEVFADKLAMARFVKEFNLEIDDVSGAGNPSP